MQYVEVRRRNGDLLKFQDAYKDLCLKLSDIICMPTHVKVNTETCAAG